MGLYDRNWNTDTRPGSLPHERQSPRFRSRFLGRGSDTGTVLCEGKPGRSIGPAITAICVALIVLLLIVLLRH